MNIVDILADAHGGNGLQSIGRQFGLDPTQTRAALEALAPMVAAGMSRNAGQDGGLADLFGAVLGGNHARYAEEADAVDHGRVRGDGDAILGHIFGSKEVSRGVAQQAADMSGIGSSILKKMLPVIAAMVMGALAKKMTGGGARQASGGGGGGLGDILGDILGGGASAPRGGQGGGGLGDILGDILGGGGRQTQAPQGQGDLNDILKDIFGGGRIPDGSPAPAQPEAARRGRDALDDMLGRRGGSGTAADDLLNSVERAIRGGG